MSGGVKNAQGATILIVDDEYIVRKIMLSMVLVQFKY
jgi:hypothetical protein